MKAALEKIVPGFGSSFTYRRFTDVNYCGKPYWHVHPEYEIVYISDGRGKRHIGDHISYYNQGDLIFLGPDIPHFGFTEELLDDHCEVVVQMKPDFLGADFFDKPEMKAIQQLFEKSHQGLSFYGEIKETIGARLDRMNQLNNFEQLIELLQILHELALSSEYKILNVKGYAVEVNAQDQERMRIVYTFVEQNFHQPISLEQVASEVSMTVPAFCRYFKKLTRKTFTQFVNEFRVAHACRLLGDEHLSIAAVSFECGFNNLSHFNKQFKLVTGESPRDYRKNLKKLVT